MPISANEYNDNHLDGLAKLLNYNNSYLKPVTAPLGILKMLPEEAKLSIFFYNVYGNIPTCSIV